MRSRARRLSPLARGVLDTARCEFSTTTGVRPATLQSERTGFLRAYAGIIALATVPLQVSCLPTITDSGQVDQLRDYADSRLLSGCIYCGGPAETRDHVPSRCLLDRPYPENLPVVGCCKKCNKGFSGDEQYLVCLVESALCGSTDPSKIQRPSVARILQNTPALRARIEAAKTETNDHVMFAVEHPRVANVMLKLARGHAAFELSQPCRIEPDHFWCQQLTDLPAAARKEFDAAHVQDVFGEVGSRGMQRMLVTQVTLQSESGDQRQLGLIVNDWVEVQDGRYRYLAIDDVGGVVIRIIVSEYLACEVAWRLA